jgi:hypothetical protein
LYGTFGQWTYHGVIDRIHTHNALAFLKLASIRLRLRKICKE